LKYQAILFDLDGTLLDSVPFIMRVTRVVCDQMKLPIDDTRIRNSIGLPLRVQAADFAGENADEFVEVYRGVYRAATDGENRLFPGTSDMLDEVRRRGYKTAVVTSKMTRGTHLALEETGIDGKFDAVVTADDVEHFKPHPDPIIKALEKLGMPREAAAFVGDSLIDVETAQRAGVIMLGVSWGARPKEDLLFGCLEAVFDDWDGFLDWLDGDHKSPNAL